MTDDKTNNKFWINFFGSLIVWPLLIILSIGILITGIILSVRNAYYNPITTLGILLLIAEIIITFFHKDIFSKVTFTNEAIKIEKFGKTLITVKWQDIYSVKGAYYGKSSTCLLFYTENQSIRIIPSKKMYFYILSICPRDDLKDTIKNLSQFSWFNK